MAQDAGKDRDSRTGGNIGRRTGGKIGRRTGGKIGRRTGGKIGRRTGRKIGRRTGGKISRRTGRNTLLITLKFTDIFSSARDSCLPHATIMSTFWRIYI